MSKKYIDGEHRLIRHAGGAPQARPTIRVFSTQERQAFLNEAQQAPRADIVDYTKGKLDELREGINSRNTAIMRDLRTRLPEIVYAFGADNIAQTLLSQFPEDARGDPNLRTGVNIVEREARKKNYWILADARPVGIPLKDAVPLQKTTDELIVLLNKQLQRRDRETDEGNDMFTFTEQELIERAAAMRQFVRAAYTLLKEHKPGASALLADHPLLYPTDLDVNDFDIISTKLRIVEQLSLAKADAVPLASKLLEKPHIERINGIHLAANIGPAAKPLQTQLHDGLTKRMKADMNDLEYRVYIDSLAAVVADDPKIVAFIKEQARSKQWGWPTVQGLLEAKYMLRSNSALRTDSTQLSQPALLTSEHQTFMESAIWPAIEEYWDTQSIDNLYLHGHKHLIFVDLQPHARWITQRLLEKSVQLPGLEVLEDSTPEAIDLFNRDVVRATYFLSAMKLYIKEFPDTLSPQQVQAVDDEAVKIATSIFSAFKKKEPATVRLIGALVMLSEQFPAVQALQKKHLASKDNQEFLRRELPGVIKQNLHQNESNLLSRVLNKIPSDE